MRRVLLICFAFVLLAATVNAAPALQEQEAVQGAPQITSFTTTTNAIIRDALANRTARVPVAWTTENRPLTANLVFEQVLPGGAVINVELPRPLPWVVSNGQGMAAPILPRGLVDEIVLRVRMVNLFTGSVLSEREITMPVVSGRAGGGVGDRAAITSFITTATFVNQDQLVNGSARIPLSWVTENRAATMNLVFEQVLDDGTTVNVELPRDNPYAPSSGNGIAAPVPPGGDADAIILRVSLFDLLNGRVYDLREVTVPVLAAGATPTHTPPPSAEIRTFTLDAANLNADELANGTARVVVHWEVVNRPNFSNLVFEQVLSDGTVVNVELPRPDPQVPSQGSGLIAPRPPGGSATTARFILSLVSLTNAAVYDRAEVTLPIVTPPTPSATALPTATPTAPAQSYDVRFSATVSSISRQQITAGGIIEVSWSVTPRPADSNLFFEQVFPDGSVYNVELPRPNPYVPSAGLGAVAPLMPPTSVNQIVLRVRLASNNGRDTLAQRELIMPLTGETSVTPSPRRFDVFTPSTLVIENSQISGGSVVIPISWNVTQRPTNSNLVFEQVFPDGSFDNAELPRPDPIVPSAGTGAVRLRDPGASVTEVRVRVRLVQLNGSTVYDQRELVIPIANRGVSAAPEASAEPQSVEVTSCTDAWFDAALQGCPSGPQQQLAVIVQQFERGVMIYRSDLNQVYFLTDAGTVIAGQPGTFEGIAEPPSGLYAPSSTFAGLWGANQERAGWATTPEGSYLATVQSSADALYLTLPDGRIARLTPVTSPASWQAVS